jgi:hypothetical protein
MPRGQFQACRDTAGAEHQRAKTVAEIEAKPRAPHRRGAAGKAHAGGRHRPQHRRILGREPWRLALVGKCIERVQQTENAEYGAADDE